MQKAETSTLSSLLNARPGPFVLLFLPFSSKIVTIFSGKIIGSPPSLALGKDYSDPVLLLVVLYSLGASFLVAAVRFTQLEVTPRGLLIKDDSPPFPLHSARYSPFLFFFLGISCTVPLRYVEEIPAIGFLARGAPLFFSLFLPDSRSQGPPLSRQNLLFWYRHVFIRG